MGGLVEVFGKPHAEEAAQSLAAAGFDGLVAERGIPWEGFNVVEIDGARQKIGICVTMEGDGEEEEEEERRVDHFLRMKRAFLHASFLLVLVVVEI